MCLFCQCPLGIHRPPCPLAVPDGIVVGTSPSTTWPGFTCSECGRDTSTLVNSRCPDCATGEPDRRRGSWVCGRCGASNAPHADQCTCKSGEIQGFKITITNGTKAPIDAEIQPILPPDDNNWCGDGEDPAVGCVVVDGSEEPNDCRGCGV